MPVFVPTLKPITPRNLYPVFEMGSESQSEDVLAANGIVSSASIVTVNSPLFYVFEEDGMCHTSFQIEPVI